MTFLAPIPALIAAAVAVPALILLYMLRLRRVRRPISSTLLWERSANELVANAPIRRLRWSWLLILQLLALLALLAALARPAAPAESLSVGRTIVLIDRSASMSARLDPELDSTRLDRALEQLDALIDDVSEGRDAELMVIAFASAPTVLSGFESDPERLRAALRAITPTDETADLDAALELAGAFSRQGEDGASTAPEVVLLSDGAVAPPRSARGFTVRSSRFRQMTPDPSDRSGPNLGIAAFEAERSYDDPARVQLFVRLVNSGVEPVEVPLTVRANDEPLLVRTIAVPAAGPDGPGEGTVTAGAEIVGEALLVAALPAGDALPDDDVAGLVLPAPRRLRLALAAPDGAPDPFLLEVLEAMEPESLLVGGPELLASGPDRIDLLVLDRLTAPADVAVPTLAFGGGLPGAEPPTNDRSARRVLSWERQHPLLRHVPLDALVFGGPRALALTDQASVILSGPDGPMAAVITDRGVRHAAIGFPLRQSNLPVLPGFPVLIQNALDYLGAAGAGSTGRSVRAGETLELQPAPGAAAVTVRPSAGEDPVVTIPIRPGERSVVIPAPERAGLYRIDGAADELAPPILAVNVASDTESDVRVRSELPVLALADGPAAMPERVQRDRWRWFVLLLLALLMVEWFLYLVRVRRSR